MDSRARSRAATAIAPAIATAAATAIATTSLLAPLLLVGLGGAVRAASNDHLIKLLEKRSCRDCRLQDADLVHADLRDADLRGAKLQRANLSQAQLDGADLQGADLSFTSLQGASLRGADLRGARLEGTDLRQSDLSGAVFDPGGLSRTYWREARGVDPGQLGYAALHNAGVDDALSGRHPEAERLFGDAIRQQPDAAVSWAARGLSRAEQGKTELAAQDLAYAATLYERGGDGEQARQLRDVSRQLLKPSKQAEKGGNGLGGQLLSGAAGLAQVLAPLAMKFLVPMAF